LHLNTTALRNGSLHLSYGSFNYPFFFPRDSGSKKPIGFLTDVWKIFMEDLEYHQYPYAEHSSSVCDGILLPVQEGLTITTAGAYTPTAMRNRLFRQSTATYYTAFNFYEADRSSEQQSTEIAHFLSSILHFLVESIREINDDIGVQRHPIVDVLRFLSHIVLVIGVTLTVYYHAAGFRGNTVLYSNAVQTTFSDLVKGLHDGSRQLMTKSATTFTSDELFALVGNRTNQSDIAEPDQTQLLQKLCDNHALVSMIEQNAVYSMSLVKKPCELSKISIPQPWPYLENFDVEILQTYMLSWNDSSRMSVESVDQVLLRIFPQDMIENFWTNRYLSSLKDKPSIKPSTPDIDDNFVPMSLVRLQLLFYFTGPGWFLSIIIFLMEISPRFTRSIMLCLHYPKLL
ncbi:hypothetical protein PENTCL1PPCAC_11925, partial [Pristionchus entomophagus]